MRQYRILALTDHSGHSKENSLYAILAACVQHSLCHSVDVASRGNKENKSFFESGKQEHLFATTVKPDFEFDPTGKIFTDDCKRILIDDYDIILMRLPRPVSDSFLHNLKQAHTDKVIINDPLGIIRTSSKAFLLNYPELCPPIQLCKSVDAVLEIANQYPIVLKPLKEYGGKGIIRIENDTIHNGESYIDARTYLNSIRQELESDGYLAMKFLKNVDQGDKRLIVVNGHILAASLRLPPKGAWLCNVAMGGTSIPAEPDEDERQLIEVINPGLRKEGILIYGADTLVNDDGKRVLSEINTLSIGGFPQSQEQTGRPIIKQTIDLIFQYVEQQ